MRETMNHAIELLLKDFKGKALQNEPLGKYTSLKVGGIADVVVFPLNLTDLIQLMEGIRKHKVPFFVIGAGSNLIIRDGGMRGIVIKLSHFTRIEKIDAATLFVESGVFLPRLLKYTLEASLTGLEFLCSIPGNVGGAIKMNAGIPGREISDVVESVRLLTFQGEIVDIGKKEACFGYRRSKFPKGVLLGGVFKLQQASRHEVQEKIAVLLKKRRETQPLSYPNVGSIFKNPPGFYAGRLIEEVGLKGFQIGGAQISGKHANFIINKGSATAGDIIQLIKKAGKEVEAKKGLVLELEAKIIGENGSDR
jgi:UDP-N-acetylmuramate dehydrogenase